MLLILIFIFLVLTIIIFLFSSNFFSPIPYFPTNKKDLPLIIKALDLKNKQIIFDLGAGDGIVIFEAAKKAYEKKLNTKFFAVEINPILILIMYIKRLFHPNKKNIKIIYEDIFKMNFNINSKTSKTVNSQTFYLYISPWYMEKTLKNIKKQIKKFKIVSYFYPLPKIKPKKTLLGVNKIFIY